MTENTANSLPTPTIRPLRPEDESQWRALWNGYLEFYESSLAPEIYDATFARLCDPARTHQRALVAEQDGKLLGLVHIIFHSHNWRIEDVCYLQDLYVTPDARGLGLGRALIEATYKLADDAGCPTVYWMTQEFNETARLLYDRIATLTPFIKYQR
ncbi:GNAT family N-acetyltransferase [Thalassospira marina]|uniref:GNAT family N-acetyltransferase n=1 Tax=Thalassospira marina TaxID=2048283 RepID=A0A2N3L099_9PROT|nr:GNAT family N-acetyltransferase [Thalassospira marina]PKR56146.1 GNAT family N-acetyltransferase [Thalassospira marina]